MQRLTSIEMCAGAGGQALGLEQAGFDHLACVEWDAHACATLRHNRPEWEVLEDDIRSDAILQRARTDWHGVDLLAGGVPCPPFSVAGKQLGEDDERDLFPAMLDLARACVPRAVMIENVRGLLSPTFAGYRERLADGFRELGLHIVDWKLFQASSYGVPQLRPRVIMIALREEYLNHFEWPEPDGSEPPTVGEALRDLMASRGWEGAGDWAAKAASIAPTLVGGSRKHGGPDLGPTRAKQRRPRGGLTPMALGDAVPEPGFDGAPRLTVEIAPQSSRASRPTGTSAAARPMRIGKSATPSRPRSRGRSGEGRGRPPGRGGAQGGLLMADAAVRGRPGPATKQTQGEIDRAIIVKVCENSRWPSGVPTLDDSWLGSLQTIWSFHDPKTEVSRAQPPRHRRRSLPRRRSSPPTTRATARSLRFTSPTATGSPAGVWMERAARIEEHIAETLGVEVDQLPDLLDRMRRRTAGLGSSTRTSSAMPSGRWFTRCSYGGATHPSPSRRRCGPTTGSRASAAGALDGGQDGYCRQSRATTLDPVLQVGLRHDRISDSTNECQEYSGAAKRRRGKTTTTGS